VAKNKRTKTPNAVVDIPEVLAVVLRDDVTFRQESAERVGLGFELVHIGLQRRYLTKWLASLKLKDWSGRMDLNLDLLVPNQGRENT
jgi:hypothetical protein